MNRSSPLFILALLLLADHVLLAQESEVPKITFRKWSGKLNVPDPVAVSVDNQGRVFVTQTRRRKIQDLDIRQHKQWIPTDLGLRSVEDKRNFFKSVMAIGGDDKIQKEHVGDFNEDGHHDWRDLTVISEVIYRLVDGDGDGTADEIKTFSEQFDSEVTGVAAGVLAFQGDVYATVAPDVWKLRDTDQDGLADTREVIAHGFGLHIAYGGHDMHGLTVGPDGKIYWSIGDKGINVTTADGTNYAYPDQGGVMRCNPDGSDFEVFAHGLRNVQEFAFDSYGNIFGIDNDADQTNERERFVQIVDQMDAGWRCFYQYRGGSYNPWTEEKLWELSTGKNHPAYIVPPIQHYIDGPAGFKFNPGTALSPQYRDYFFVTGAPNGNQHAFRVEPEGDSFKMVDEHQFGKGIPIVGLAFGPDGALYGADWDGGYPLDEKGSVIRMDVAEDLSESRREVQTLLASGFAESSMESLVLLLDHADMRVRMGAQFELVSRNLTDQLSAKALDESAGIFARLHALWGLGQLARKGDTLARDTIGMLLNDDDAKLRGQAAKTYGEIPDVPALPLLPLVKDKDIHVQVLTLLALGRTPSQQATDDILELAGKLQPQQHYLRHAICTALASCVSAEKLAEQTKHKSEMLRLCCVLALRKTLSPKIVEFLQDESSWVRDAAARAIHDDESIPDAMEQLALGLNLGIEQSEAFFRRSVNANFRLGDSESAERLVKYVESSSDRLSVPLRQQHVLETLGEWNSPDVLGRVQGIHRRVDQSQRTLDKISLATTLLNVISNERADLALRKSALVVAGKLKLDLPTDKVENLALDEALDEEIRILTLRSFAQKLPDALMVAQNSKSERVRLAALEILAQQDDQRAIRSMTNLARSAEQLSTQQQAILSLATLESEGAQKEIEHLAEQFLDGELDSRLGLELFESVSGLFTKNSETQKRFRDFAVAKLDDPKLSKFAFSKSGGDSKRGEDLFRNHVQAQCARCHRIGPQGSEIGPELTKIASKRDSAYLWRAILQPSKEIEDKYRSQSILLDSDEIIKGVILSESDETLIIANEKGEEIKIPQAEIIQVKEQELSLMPEMHNVLTPREVRDLLAYLQTLK